MPISSYQNRPADKDYHTMFDVNPDHPSSLCCVCDNTVRYNDQAVIVRGMNTQHIAHKKCATSINRY